MPIPARSTFLFLSTVLAAIAAIAGAMAGGGLLWLHYIGKPLATLLLLWIASRCDAPLSTRYRTAVLAGLALSLVGDVLLMLPVDLFVPGLIAFLLAHLCYIVAFAAGSNGRARAMAFLPVAVVAAVNLAGLLPQVAAPLKAPVVVYTLVLGTMAAFALARAFTPAIAHATPRSARMGAVGAVCFMISDSLLAWDKFGGGLPMSALTVLGTYYVAQWCIAQSVRRA